MNTYTEFHPSSSPLFMAMHDPTLHQFISYLAEKKKELEANPESPIRLELSRDFITRVRESFKQTILDGERHLHLLAHSLATILLDREFELHSNVIGVLPNDKNRPFLIREKITRETLFSVTDIDLGNHLLDNFRYYKDKHWVSLALSANFIEYLPIKRTNSHVNRLTSRVKAEEELWNKVTDEIFALDELMLRDKHLRQYSKFVKDIFGIKIVCEDELTCLKIHDQLKTISLDDKELEHLTSMGNPNVSESAEDSRHLDFIEIKDYLTCEPAKMKRTGWKALKSVVLWKGRMFEIQVQPLSNYYLELDHMSGPSHGSFKLARDTMREEIGKRVPLYRFYRDLLKVLFEQENICFDYENASVIIT